MPQLQPAQIAGLYRYPVKGLSPEPMPQVALTPGQTVPSDRRYAIENGPPAASIRPTRNTCRNRIS